MGPSQICHQHPHEMRAVALGQRAVVEEENTTSGAQDLAPAPHRPYRVLVTGQDPRQIRNISGRLRAREILAESTELPSTARDLPAALPIVITADHWSRDLSDLVGALRAEGRLVFVVGTSKHFDPVLAWQADVTEVVSISGNVVGELALKIERWAARVPDVGRLIFVGPFVWDPVRHQFRERRTQRVYSLPRVQAVMLDCIFMASICHEGRLGKGDLQRRIALDGVTARSIPKNLSVLRDNLLTIFGEEILAGDLREGVGVSGAVMCKTALGVRSQCWLG